jgi:hypothetical protein
MMASLLSRLDAIPVDGEPEATDDPLLSPDTGFCVATAAVTAAAATAAPATAAAQAATSLSSSSSSSDAFRVVIGAATAATATAATAATAAVAHLPPQGAGLTAAAAEGCTWQQQVLAAALHPSIDAAEARVVAKCTPEKGAGEAEPAHLGGTPPAGRGRYYSPVVCRLCGEPGHLAPLAIPDPGHCVQGLDIRLAMGFSYAAAPRVGFRVLDRGRRHLAAGCPDRELQPCTLCGVVGHK